MKKYDFSGWVTRNDLLCSDGRTIKKNAFAHQDGMTVPLVWQHDHNDPTNILGQIVLENRPEGVYGYGAFNRTKKGLHAKECVEHGDVTSLSIYANKLKQNSSRDVLHGDIKEVSLVLAGANPGAFIDNPIMAHSGDTVETEAIIYTGIEGIHLEHACKKKELEHESEDEENKPIEKVEELKKKSNVTKESEDTDDTEENSEEESVEETKDDSKISEIIERLKKNIKHSYNFEEETMNVFENNNKVEAEVLTHSDIESIFSDAERCGSLKESVLAHTQNYGITNISELFPEAHQLNNTPDLVKPRNEWVASVMGGVKRTPFSRIKTRYADVTADSDSLRALGYVKGNFKKEEYFSVAGRSTGPVTIYKKQKFDRDDLIDVTDFDVVAWVKGEMKMMLEEEIARAILLGDGRSATIEKDQETIPNPDKILDPGAAQTSGNGIRAIIDDNDLYIKKFQFKVDSSASEEDIASDFMEQVLRNRKTYRGEGNPVLFVDEDLLTDMLLIKDLNGHRMYKSESELCAFMRVSKIVPCERMHGLKRSYTISDSSVECDVRGIVVDLGSYSVGHDKKGEVSMFDDFDIDYNQYKYLMETRLSGAMTRVGAGYVIASYAE